MSVRFPLRRTFLLALAAVAFQPAGAQPPTAPPANTVAPSISGTPKVGLSLISAPGTWTGAPSPTFTYQWDRCDSLGGNCTDISGATSFFYNPTLADAGSTIRVVVTGTNGSGTAVATSDQTTPVLKSPAMTVQPSISGSEVVGQTLAADPGTWIAYPAPTYSYQWRQCDPGLGTCTDISAATSSTYLVDASDVGFTIRVAITATNSAGSAFAASNQTATVTLPPAVAPANTGIPTISGTATLGQQLTASTGTWTGYPAPTYTYQWRRCDTAGANCADIASATASTYTLVSADSDKTIRAVVTATNASGNTPATSTQTATITPTPYAPVNTAPPTISGTTLLGAVLTANPGTFNAFPAPTSTYAWLRCDAAGSNCSPIAGATGTTYTLANADLASTIVVQQTASNSSGSTTTASAATSLVVTAPSNTSLPTISGTTIVGQTLTATTGTWSGVPAPTLTYQWQRCDAAGANCAAIGGATSANYTLGPADPAHTIRAAVTGTNGSGNSTALSAQSAAITTAPVAPTLIVAPSVTGTPRVGEVLSVQPGTWSGTPTPTITYQWQRCDVSGANCANISGETAATHTLVGADVGATIRVVVTAMNVVGSSSNNAAVAGPVLPGRIEAASSKVYTTPADSATGSSAADSVPADGSRFSRVRVELRDGAGDLTVGRAADVVLTIDGVATASPVRETSTPGIYELEVRSTKVNVVTVSISIDGVTLQDRAKIVFVKAVADLDIKLSANNETPQIGDTVVFTVEVKNLGPNAATGVEVEHKLSDRAAYVSSEATRGQYDAVKGIWTVGNLALGESVVLKVTVTVTK